MTAHHLPWDREEVAFVLNTLRDIGVIVTDLKTDGLSLIITVQAPGRSA